MTTFDSAQFEALWQSATTQPVTPPATQTKAKPVDVSLGSILDRYLAMVATQRDDGKVSQEDYDALAAAMGEVKTILARINDSDLVAQAKAVNAQARLQQATGQGGRPATG
ncbi:MAG: hypothetical protein ACR2IK_03110 [Chloroflexota bacterium]